MSNDVWFVLYYGGDDEGSFKRAAYTEARCMERASDFSGGDQLLVLDFLTEADFVTAWRRVDRTARERRAKVKHGVVLSHAGTSVDSVGQVALLAPSAGEGRLYTAVDNVAGVDLEARQSRSLKGDGNFTTAEIAELPRLPWADRSTLQLRGCRTGLGTPSVAQAFRDSQQVRVEGQTGWADFSSRRDRWVQIGAESREVYLQAYDKGLLAEDWGKNGVRAPFGSGELRPVIVEYPSAPVRKP